MNKQIFGSLDSFFSKNLWRVLVVLVVIAAFAITFLYLQRGKISTIEIIGEGKVNIEPDSLRYSAIIEAKKLTADDAKKATSDQVSLITKLLLAEGLAVEDVKTQNVIVAPEYQSTPAGMKVSNYSGQETLAIVFRDISKQKKILDILIENGAASLIGPSPLYSSDKISAARKAAETKAIEDAKSRATSAAKEAGNNLGRAIKISQANIGMPAQIAAAAPGDLVVSSGETSVAPMANENEIVAQITITYSLK